MPSPPENSLFYAHLVGTAVLQLVLVAIALANQSAAMWLSVLIVVSMLTLAAHGYLATRRTGSNDRQAREGPALSRRMVD